jgi:hypothetical protein
LINENRIAFMRLGTHDLPSTNRFMAAFVTEPTARSIHFIALRTGYFQFAHTRIAKLGAYFIFSLAFWAFHFLCPPELKKGRFER